MSDNPVGDGQVLLFNVGDTYYGLPVIRIESIIAAPDPTPVAGAPHYVLGMFNLRGRVLPIVDLAGVLGQHDDEPAERVVVVQSRESAIGLAVRSVSEVASIAADDVDETPAALRGSGWLNGVYRRGDDLVSLLDLDAIVHSVDAA